MRAPRRADLNSRLSARWLALVLVCVGCAGRRPLLDATSDAPRLDGLRFQDAGSTPGRDGLGDGAPPDRAADRGADGALDDSSRVKDGPRGDAQPPDKSLASDLCPGPTEQLDGKDNNCNGQIDEGFWAVPMTATYLALTQRQPLCTASKAFSDLCMSGANRHCTAQGYVGGFGPVEYGPTSGTVVCVADAVLVQVSYAALNARHPSCPSTGIFSLFCSVAFHRHCVALGAGYVSGIGPVEHGLNTASALCIRHAILRQVSLAVLAQQHPQCTPLAPFSPSCQAAINRYCVAQGQATGWGPVELASNVATVACLQRQ